MTEGPPEPNPDDGGRPEEGPILSPEELDIADDEHVTQLDEGRFVVSPDARVDQQPGGKPGRQSQQSGPDTDRQREPDTQSQSTPAPGPSQSPEDGRAETGTGTETAIDEERVHEWLRESFAGNSSRYGFDVTATFDGSVSQRRMASNDVVTIFESLMLWYAQQIDSDTPVEEILGILLMESNVPIRYPPESLRNLLQSTDLGPDDTIADLLAAVDDDDGVQL